MTDDTGFFVKLGLKEMHGRLEKFCSEEIFFSIWCAKSENYHDAILCNRCQDCLEFAFVNTESSKSFKDAQLVYVHFFLGGRHFFSEGNFAYLRQGYFKIGGIENYYKFEQRAKERLLTFPHRKIYFFVDVKNKSDTSNVISINAVIGHRDDIFNDFIARSCNEKLMGNQGRPMTGFRVLDISLNGISFLANKVEKKYFEDCSQWKDCKIDFNGEIFEVEYVDVGNITDYVDPRSLNTPMYKIGASMKNVSRSLKDLVCSYLGGDQLLHDADVEYRLFLKKHGKTL